MKKRFMEKVKKVDGCWIWTAAIRGQSGYGCFKISGKLESSHRVSYKIFKGEIPNGKFICHTCDNRKCVNPKHLFVGSRSENMIDAYKKNRIVLPKEGQFKKGSKHPNSKLTEKDVSDIRLLYKKVSVASLAKRYNIDRTLIWRITTGRVWN